MVWLRKVKCLLGRHRYIELKKITPDCVKLSCIYCKKYFMYDESKIIHRWHKDLERIQVNHYEFMVQLKGMMERLNQKKIIEQLNNQKKHTEESS